MKMRKLSLPVVFFMANIALAAKPTAIQYISPVHNSTLNSRTSGIIIRPGGKLDEASIDFSGQIVVTGTTNNRYSGDIILSSDGKTLIFKPTTQYNAGEDVQVSFLSGVKDQTGNSIPSFEFQFTVTPLETPLDPKDYLSETSSEIAKLQDSIAKSLSKTTGLAKTVTGELPGNFPKFTLTPGTGAPADGYIFLSPSHFVDKKGFNLILDNSGNIVYWQEITDGTPVCFQVLPNGYLGYGSMYEFYDFTGGGPTKFYMMDSSYTIVDEFKMGNGYVAESHEFQLLPNGHALMLSYDLQSVDMSKIVPGGHPGATVVGSIIQEVDGDKNVVFQWRSWDYLDIKDSYNDLTLKVFDPIHINSLDMDSDNHLLVSVMALAEIVKINRQTGAILWIMGGKNNQFTFVNEEEVSAYAPEYFMYQHDVRRLDNGNILMIDDGQKARRDWSRVVEYQIDETNLTATKVWQYRHDPDISVSTMGSAQRLPNGNTLIGWGMGSAVSKTAVTEVDPSGNVVLELAFNANLWSSYRAQKYDWHGGTHFAQVLRWELAADNSYTWDGEDGVTGITMDIKSFTGFGYNEILATCYHYAPIKPTFSGKAPLVLPHRIVLRPFNLAALKATLKFNAELYGIDKPDSILIYYRPSVDSGEFIVLPTSYNSVTKQL
ncbi:MAG: aryl-sulfate sulfotransferase, partial [Chitinispirillaceae bacterium]|nr:aryl-sulfate sulfotransferase [Chitinispirillaceae bacterium]